MYFYKEKMNQLGFTEFKLAQLLNAISDGEEIIWKTSPLEPLPPGWENDIKDDKTYNFFST